jgi:hypothetical protein
VQTACARAGEVLAGAPLDNGNVDARQRQLAGQHQPCRTSSGDHHRMLGHRHTPIGTSGTPTLPSDPAKSVIARFVPAVARILVIQPSPYVLFEARTILPNNTSAIDGLRSVTTVVVQSGQRLATFGRPGHMAGNFKWVHNIAIDSKGTIYTAEVGDGRRVQKFKRAN